MTYTDTTRQFDKETSGPGPWEQLAPKVDADLGPNREVEFGRPNGLAMPVNQRSPAHWSGHTLTVSSASDQQQSPSSVVSEQRGRQDVTILVPTTSAAAVWLAESEAALTAANPIGFYLAVGAALTIRTEGAIYAISAIAGTDTKISVAVTWG